MRDPANTWLLILAALTLALAIALHGQRRLHKQAHFPIPPAGGTP